MHEHHAVDGYLFESLQALRDMTADWLHRYNHRRPHESLSRIPPVENRVKQFPSLYFQLAQEIEVASLAANALASLCRVNR